jgi:hypothetical protein
MLALIVGLFWLAILAPWAVVKFRNSRAEKSIDHFHAEHEVLSRQNYSVAPARRLDDAYLYEEYAYEPEHEATRSRPRLTVVQDHDTYSSLESRATWDDWDRDYDYDQPRGVGPVVDSRAYAQHRYAAYASAPAQPVVHHRGGYEPVLEAGYAPLAGSMRVRRNRIFVSLGLSALVTTGLNFLIGLSLLQYLAVLSWIALVFYSAAALFAVSQGYLEVSSLVGHRRTRAFAPADEEEYVEDQVYDEDPAYYEEEAYEQAADADRWRRESRRYALG